MKKISLLSFIIILLIGTAFIPKSKKVVILDVSHGGHDAGVMIEGLNEKDITLSIAQKVQELNSDGKLEIILTREIDHFISLKDRVNFINEMAPTLLISIHANYSEKTEVNGFEIYIKKNALTQESLSLASNIENAYPSQIKKRNITESNFYILKNSKCPAMNLEVGFLSNPVDRKFLTSEEGQWEVAEAIYGAIK